MQTTDPTAKKNSKGIYGVVNHFILVSLKLKLVMFVFTNYPQIYRGGG